MAAVEQLQARPSSVFHDSSCYFAVCHGIEHQLVELSQTVRAINLCPHPADSHDLELTDYEVGIGLVSLLDNQASDYPHSEISFSMIRWSDLGVPDEHKFIRISTTMMFGNCAKCFRPWPMGLKCRYCRGPEYTRSIMLYFVSTESAASVVISSSAAPPAMVCSRFKPCDPLRVGITLLHLGTKPYFDEIYYNSGFPREKYHEDTRYSWKAIPIIKLIDAYIENAYPDDPSPELIKQRLHQFTGLAYIDIFECMNQRRTTFDPELWDAIVLQRSSLAASSILPRQQPHLEQDQRGVG